MPLTQNPFRVHSIYTGFLSSSLLLQQNLCGIYIFWKLFNTVHLKDIYISKMVLTIFYLYLFTWTEVNYIPNVSFISPKVWQKFRR